MKRLLTLSGFALFTVAVLGFLYGRRPHNYRLAFSWDVDWPIEHQLGMLVTSFWLFAGACWCFCGAALMSPVIRKKLASLPIGLGVFVLLSVGYLTFVMVQIDHDPRTFRLKSPDGVPYLLVSDGGLSPGASLWRLDASELTEDPDITVGTEIWPPYGLRTSARPGRYALLGTRNEVGAILDLTVPQLIAWRELTDLEALREEFGEDVMLVRRQLMTPQ